MGVARTERLLNLLTLLLNVRRPASLREIKEYDEFSVYRTEDPKSGERTFERDKATLLELGVPLRWVAPEEQEDDEDCSGGYVVDRERYFLADPRLEPGELALLSIAGAAALAIEGFPGRAAVIRALAKLGFDVDEQGHAPTLAHAPLEPGLDAPRVGANLEVLHDAVGRRHRVEILYRAAGSQTKGEATRRQVSPYGLYYRHGAWYLVGHCHLREAERTFHLGRMEKVKRLSGPRGRAIDVPATFDLAAHVQQRPWEFPNEPPYDVVIRLAERLVPATAEIFGRRVTVDRLDAGAIVRLRVSHTQALVSAVLPYGAAAEVVAPEALRERMRRTYASLVRRYGDEESVQASERPALEGSRPAGPPRSEASA